jgi:hypothetical protein
MKGNLLPAVRAQAGASAFHVGAKDFASPASLDFSRPSPINLPLTTGAGDEPAEMPDLKFPRRAFLPVLQATVLNLPAGAEVLHPFFHGQEKQHQPFDVPGDSPPPLLETLDGPDRGPQELGHLFLGFLQAPTKSGKFSGVHGSSSLEKKKRDKYFS